MSSRAGQASVLGSNPAPPPLPAPLLSVPRQPRCARPKRPLLAMVVVCATVCWLMLLESPSAPQHVDTIGALETAAAAAVAAAAATAPYAAFAPPPKGPPPDPATWRGLSEDEINKLSRLGRFLFLNDTENMRPQNKTFTILMWKHGQRLERRHIKLFGKERHDPFEHCSVSNCRVSYKDEDLFSADAVIFHLHLTKGPDTLPERNATNEYQRWIFLTDESPHNTFLYRSSQNNLKNYPGIFNWSMTYRLDADVPVPYGRTVPLSASEAEAAASATGGVARNYARGKTGMVAIMGSNCGGVNHRWDYVRQLQKHIPIDVYGGCGPLKCPGHYGKDCPSLRNFKFYLAFENSNCKDYMTEKLWWNAYKNDAVPVIMGASKENCNKLLPRRSYLHSANFASPADLGRFILHLNSSDRDYNAYFEWKYNYKILNEHGYFQSPSYHYCRVCEALNYNDPAPKVYEHPETFWNVKEYCHYDP